MIQLPPASILVHTQETLSACEIAEVMDDDSVDKSQVAVTQMAILLHLGNYNHARHLWRRYKSFCCGKTMTNNNNTKKDQGWDVFERLWKVGQAMIELKYELVYHLLFNEEESNKIPWKDELVTSFRKQMLSLHERTHNTISTNDCLVRFGFSTEEEMSVWLQQQEWEYDNTSQHWIPAIPEPYHYPTQETTNSNKTQEQIQTMSSVVHFLEQKQLNV